jgi:hypothetical protein
LSNPECRRAIPAKQAATEEILEIGLEGFDVWVQTPNLKKSDSKWHPPESPLSDRRFETSALPMFDSSHPLTTDQLNSTSLKWGNDGELSELDLQRILGLLSQVDPVAEALMEGRSEAA